MPHAESPIERGDRLLKEAQEAIDRAKALRPDVVYLVGQILNGSWNHRLSSETINQVVMTALTALKYVDIETNAYAQRHPHS